MLGLKQFDDNIRETNEEVMRHIEAMRKMDHSSEEYANACKALRDLQGSRYTGVRSRSDWKEHLVPGWLLQAAGMGFGILAWKKTVDLEVEGAVVSSQGLNAWDKVVRKFTALR